MEKLIDLRVPWSHTPTDEEVAYRNAGFVRTTGTCFAPVPDIASLCDAFDKLHPKSNLSVGARALCKHHARHPDHPFWRQPTGPEAQKNAIARQHLGEMLEAPVWRNIHQLQGEQPVYEVRNALGYGMRWMIGETVEFRGYLEPQL
jgi:hypothetical protein